MNPQEEAFLYTEGLEMKIIDFIIRDVRSLQARLDDLSANRPCPTTGIRPQDLNRRVEVEQRLLDASTGKRPPPDRDECRALALRLGTPDDAPDVSFALKRLIDAGYKLVEAVALPNAEKVRQERPVKVWREAVAALRGIPYEDTALNTYEPDAPHAQGR